MTPEENIPSEKAPNEKTAPKTEPQSQPLKSSAVQPKKKPSGFQLVLRQIGLALLFLLIGMLGILLALYLPANRQLKNAQAELDRLKPIETQYTDLQQSYTRMEAQTLVYKLMSDTSQLKEALNENDSFKATQQLTYIEQDLGKLELSSYPDLPASLNGQFTKIKTSVSGNSTSAGSDVDKFYNALLNLLDNLQ